MADSQSLLLIAPRPAPQPAGSESAKKTAKPTQDKSFGQKLDKAKKQIADKTSDTKNAPAVIKKPAVVPAPDQVPAENAPTPDAGTPVADATDTPVPTNPTIEKPVQKAPKPIVKNVDDDARSTDEDDPAAPVTKTQEPVPVKAIAPTKAATPAPDKPKKAAKTIEPKVDLTQTAAVTSAVAVKTQPLVTPQVDTPGLDTSAAATIKPSEALPSAVESTPVENAAAAPVLSHAAPATGNAASFGAGKVLGKSDADNANLVVANAATGSAVNAAENNSSTAELDPVAVAADENAADTDSSSEKSSTSATAHTPGVTADVTGLASSASAHVPAALAMKSTSAAHEVSPQVRFAEDNHPKIVTSIAGQLLPRGGTMQLQLNPADLGALQVTVHLQDGVVTASFETSNDDATKLLSHSLGQLKQGLEAAGVNVEKLHVERAPQQDTKNDSEGESKQPMQEHQKNAQQDQQRREMVQRMWRRLAGGADPLDLVA